MTIVLISNLYPTENNSKKSKALLAFTKEWCLTDKVFVLKPFYLPQEIFSIKYGLFNNEGVQGCFLPVLKVPKFFVFLHGNIDKYLKKRDVDPDIIISHMPVNHFVAYHYAKTKQLPLVTGVHMSDIKLLQNGNDSHKIKLIEIYKYTAKIACRSNAIYDQLITLLPDLKEKAFVAFSGIDKQKIISREQLDEKVDNIQKNSCIRFITVAQLKKLKNIDSVLYALSLLPKEMLWTYTIVGDGRERKFLEALSLSLNLQGKIRFIGEVSHSKVFNYLNKADVFVMPSAPETFGLSYLEAMASGLIVIGAKNWGIDGIVINQKNGFLVHARDNRELGETMASIIQLRDSKKLAEIYNKSYETILQYSNIDAAKNYLDQIKEVVLS